MKSATTRSLSDGAHLPRPPATGVGAVLIPGTLRILLLSLSLGGCAEAGVAPVSARSAQAAAEAGRDFSEGASELSSRTYPKEEDVVAEGSLKASGGSWTPALELSGSESDWRGAKLELQGVEPHRKGAKTEEADSKSTAEASKIAGRPQMSKKAKSFFDAGRKAFAAGDLQGAKTQYSAAVKADGKAYEAHYALAVVYERLGSPKNARSSYQKAYGIVRDHEESIVAFAILQAREGDPDGALSFLQKKTSDVGKSAALLAAMAEVNSLKGDSGAAQSLAQQSLKMNPNYKPAMVALARDHYRARRIDLALYALTGILDGYGEGNPPRDKNNAEARMIRGLIYADRGLRGPAMEEMEKALTARPDLVDAHLVLANFMMAAGNAKEARPHLEMAIRYDNRNIAAHLQLGDAYRLLNRNEDARRELEWVLAADPNQSAAHYNLGLLFLLGKKMKGMSEEAMVDKALTHLEAYKARAVRGGPDDVDDLITRAKTKKALMKAKEEAAAAGS